MEEKQPELDETATRILESITDAFFTLDREWRFTYVNKEAEMLLLRTRQELLGKSIWEVFPEAIGSTFDTEYHRAFTKQITVTFEDFYPPLDTWFEVRAYPSPAGLCIYFRNIETRKKREAARHLAETMLKESEERFRSLADAIPHIAWTTQPDGSVDYYNQRWYEYSGSTFEETRDWGWAAVIHPDDVANAGSVWSAAITRGIVSEVDYRLKRVDGEYRWHLGRSVPIRDEKGRIIRWVGTATDIDAQKRQEQELRARAERETLTNEIGQAIRSSLDPDEIQTIAVNALGTALRADRCYFLQFDQTMDRMEISQDFRRADLPSLAGKYRISQFAVDPEDQFQNGKSLVVTDTQAETQQEFWSEQMTAMFARMQVRALINIPLHRENRLVAALGVAMADGPRKWTAEEVRLAESVATQTRSAVETAIVNRRERIIAKQLQAALQPETPEAISGMKLHKHYTAALEEAGVGGDFYDVFPLEKGCTALVVGDLSGKGLAAAAQVSTVRNMLRATLYLAGTILEAVTDLNRILVQNSLLNGFATLFVGAYDSGDGSLHYVNCGQEPGLVWRAATGQVEQLLPSGPILGAFDNAIFTERVTMLAPGDALAVFTDGLTEAGPNRLELLGVDGIIALLQEQVSRKEAFDAGEFAEYLVRRLVSSVDAYAQRGVRDDVCLLVGVVEGSAR